MSISYSEPRNDRRRLLVLSSVLTAHAQDALDSDAYISAPVLAEAQALHAPFQAEMDALSSTLAARSAAADARVHAFQYLEWGLRDAWESVKRRIRRQNLGNELLLFYGLPQSGEVPKGMPYAEWIPLGQDVLDGDTEAVAAGYAPLQDPDAAEIAAFLAAAQIAHDAMRPADKKYDNAQTAVAALRGDVDVVLAKIVRDMRYHLSVAGMDKESERRVMRGYGFTFTAAGGTPEEAVNETLAGEEEAINN